MQLLYTPSLRASLSTSSAGCAGEDIFFFSKEQKKKTSFAEKGKIEQSIWRLSSSPSSSCVLFFSSSASYEELFETFKIKPKSRKRDMW